MKVWGQVPNFHAGPVGSESLRGAAENIYIVGRREERILRKRRSRRQSYIYSRQLPPRESLGPVPKLSSHHLPQVVDGHLDIERVEARISKRHSMRIRGIVGLLVRLPRVETSVSIGATHPVHGFLRKRIPFREL